MVAKWTTVWVCTSWAATILVVWKEFFLVKLFLSIKIPDSTTWYWWHFKMIFLSYNKQYLLLFRTRTFFVSKFTDRKYWPVISNNEDCWHKYSFRNSAHYKSRLNSNSEKLFCGWAIMVTTDWDDLRCLFIGATYCSLCIFETAMI